MAKDNISRLEEDDVTVLESLVAVDMVVIVDGFSKDDGFVSVLSFSLISTTSCIITDIASASFWSPLMLLSFCSSNSSNDLCSGGVGRWVRCAGWSCRCDSNTPRFLVVVGKIEWRSCGDSGRRGNADADRIGMATILWHNSVVVVIIMIITTMIRQ